MYLLRNETDQVLASPKVFKTEKQARSHAEKIRGFFAIQGYYLTVAGERIAPEEVKFAVVSASSATRR